MSHLEATKLFSTSLLLPFENWTRLYKKDCPPPPPSETGDCLEAPTVKKHHVSEAVLICGSSTKGITWFWRTRRTFQAGRQRWLLKEGYAALGWCEDFRCSNHIATLKLLPDCCTSVRSTKEAINWGAAGAIDGNNNTPTPSPLVRAPCPQHRIVGRRLDLQNVWSKVGN